MMKVLLGTLVLIAVCWTPHISHAAGPDSVLEKCTEMRRRLEKGMGFREYFREFQQLYMDYKLPTRASRKMRSSLRPENAGKV